jgi:hypothetical protein
MSSSETSSPAPALARARLGVGGLPDALALLAPGELYAIEVDAQSLRLPLVAHTLFESLSAGVGCSLALPGDPASFLAKARLCGADLQRCDGSGELNLVRHRAEPMSLLLRGGPAAVLEAIDKAVPAGRGLLIIEQAESLLFLADPTQSVEAGDGLRDWARRRGVAVLLTCVPASRPQREFLALRSMAEDFAGLAVMRENEGGARLDVRHWFGAQGGHPRISVALRLASPGAPTAEPPPSAPARMRDATVQQIVALEGAVDDPVAAVRDASWSLVKSHAEAIEAARRLASGAIVLCFDRATPLRTLCHAVASVRRAAAPWVSVVVRERGMRLRLSQQIALTRLGASGIVPLDRDDADLAQSVRAMGGTAFMRQVPDDIEATIATAGTAVAPQLLVTRAFRDMVAEVLAAAEGIDLPHALVHVACDPAKAQQLGTLALQRKIRDAAMTVDPTGLWLFLFGCPASRALGVAERAFGRIFAEVAADTAVAGSPGAIARRVERLAAAVGTPEADAQRSASPSEGLAQAR